MVKPTEAPPSSPGGYTAVVHFPSPRSQPNERDAAAEQLLQTATAHAGYRGSVVFRSGLAATPELYLVLTFDSHESWQHWESGDPARRAIAHLDRLTGAPGDGHLLDGMAGWFDLPSSSGLTTPPRWKSAVVSFVALVPLLYLIQALLAPFTTGWNPDITGILNAVIMIVLATYLVLPFMTRVLRRWLYPQPTRTGLMESSPAPR